MAHLSFQFPRNLKQLALCFPLAIGLCAIAPQLASACSPTPGSRPAPLEERVSTTPYVFEGTITQVDGDVLTIRVNRYFKGEGSELVRLSGFNQHSCQDIINETGGRYLFFAEPGEKETWNASYDGAFGSVRSWSEEIETELGKFEPNKQSNSPRQSLPASVANAVKLAAIREIRHSTTNIQILRAEPHTWSNGCLGLNLRDRACTQATVEGWRITVRAGDRQLTYRTDNRGSIVYLDNTNNSNFPPTENPLPRFVANAVKLVAAREMTDSTSNVQILRAEPRTWSDNCLGLSFANRGCLRTTIKGWLVTVRVRNQQLTYRTDNRGNIVYRNDANTRVSPTPQRPFPQSVGIAVRSAAAKETRLAPTSIQILSAEPQTWPNGCLGHSFPNRLCTQALVEGWRVTVRAGDWQLTYRTNEYGSVVYPDNPNRSNSLPKSVLDAVKRETSQFFGISPDNLEVANAEPQTWSNGCLGVNIRNRACTEALVEGWLVELRVLQPNGNTIEAERFIYRTDAKGNTIYLDNGMEVLPANVREAILTDATQKTQLPNSQLRITEAFPQMWDGCFGIYENPRQICTKIAILGWQVAIEGEDNSLLVYHSNQDASDVRLNTPESRFANDSERRPPNEERTSLPKGAIFRAISSGGFAGGRTEITLWSDGKVTRQSSFIGNGQPQTHRVSRQQVRNFQRTLRQQHFTRYDGLNFPPPPGSADIIGMTLMSQQGMTNVADYDRDKLPQPLQIVLASWGELLGSLGE